MEDKYRDFPRPDHRFHDFDHRERGHYQEHVIDRSAASPQPPGVWPVGPSALGKAAGTSTGQLCPALCPDYRGPSCLPEVLGWARLLGLDSLEEEAGCKEVTDRAPLGLHSRPLLSWGLVRAVPQTSQALCGPDRLTPAPLGCRAAPLGFVEAVATGSALTPPLEKSPPPTTPSLVVCSQHTGAGGRGVHRTCPGETLPHQCPVPSAGEMGPDRGWRSSWTGR